MLGWYSNSQLFYYWGIQISSWSPESFLKHWILSWFLAKASVTHTSPPQNHPPDTPCCNVHLLKSRAAALQKAAQTFSSWLLLKSLCGRSSTAASQDAVRKFLFTSRSLGASFGSVLSTILASKSKGRPVIGHEMDSALSPSVHLQLGSNSPARCGL